MAFRFRSSLLLVLGVCALSLPAPSQPAASYQSSGATALGLGQSVIPLNGPWKFQIGDSPVDPATHAPQWAEESCDDSGWETVSLTPRPGSFDPFDGDPRYVPGWTAKNHPGYTGWAWYRLRVPVWPAPGEKLALAGPVQVDDGYQVFVNGQLLGGYGSFRGGGESPIVYWTQPAMFSIPDVAARNSLRAAPATELLAFRVWMGAMGLLHSPDAGGLRYAPLLGEADAIAAQIHLEWLELACQSAYHAFEAGLFLLLAIVAASLLLFDRSDPVYLWLAGVLVLTTVQDALLTMSNLTNLLSSNTYFFLDLAILGPLLLGGWGMVWWVWFQFRHPAWVPGAIAVLTLCYMCFETLGGEFFNGAIPHPLGVAAHAASVVVRLLFLVLLVGIVVWSIRQHGLEAWLALPAVALAAFSQFSSELLVLHVPVLWAPFGISIFIEEVAHLLLAAVIAQLLLRRLLLSVRRQRLMALDIKQAQEVQQLILPRARTTLPGLEVECEYRPALEVGGDFFQVLQHATDGSLLIVAGDVAGKGLKAGMLVALLVGAIRTAAQYNPDPLAVLGTLNRRLCGQGNALATCLALRIGRDGQATLASAGHLPPYLNCEPLAMEGALPLGMILSAEFSLMHFQLEEGDKVVLMSDGIAEATDAEGHLFGFEHIHQLLRRGVSAAEVASAAQKFGQEDDISVISVTRTARMEPAIA
ncbi:MAG: SpoIIE family protein phosphatase [Terracidiphilus sp.]|nr:SpoIIE family protein phosphatase [Terracidiphilus sp.]MDR3776648.1 SpoIIE family protein phosphatase [Terracidiphilus sp.]